MAKRSDFAQKLLDDLRLRKERLATSQSSSRSHYKTGDAYGHSRQTYQGSTQNRTGALRSANTQSRSSGGQKSLYSGEASNQIVAFRRGQSSQQIGDLSMALALAIENGGKLRRMDLSGNGSMLTFLQQIGRGSMELNQMERINSMDRRHSSTIRVPNLSQFHIKEISKGAQKLNQILRAWSNGANLDRYSIEIGKELLKGAMDLEESLRMLVNLEDASEFMTEPQRKNRLVLLDDDEDYDEGDVIKSTEQKQLVLPPRFSFDDPTRRSRSSQQVKAIQKPGLPALTYPAEAKSFHHKDQTQSHLKTASHKRSTSFGNNTRNLSLLQEQANLSNSPQTKSEKGKISNVIAKLMGLEELPENPDSRYIREKDKNSNQTSDRKLLKTQGSTGNVEPKTRDAPNLSVPRIQMTKPGKSLLTQDIPSAVLGPEKRLAANSFRSELVSSTEKLPWKETQKVNIETKKERTNTEPFNPNSRDQMCKQEAERRKDVKMTREERSTEIWENKGHNDELYHMAPRTPRKKDFRPTLQEKPGYRERKLQTEKRNADVLFPFHPQKPQRDNGFEQSFVLQRPEPPEEKRMRVEMKSQDVKSKGSEIVHRTSPKPVQEEVLSFQRKNLHLGQSKPQKKFGLADSIYYAQADKLPDQSRPQNRVPRRVKSEPGKGRNSTVPVVEEKRILEPAPRARKVTEPLKNKMPRKLNEMKKKGGALHNLVKPLSQASYIERAKQIRRARPEGSAETEQVKTDKSAHREHNVKSATAEASLQWLTTTNAHEHQKEAEQLAPAYACDVDESETPKLEEARHFPYDLNQNVSSVILNDPHFNSGGFGRDEELTSATIVPEPADGTAGEITHTHRLDKSEDWDDSKSGIQEKLRECERRLKHILMRSQLFLNTAEALFKLDSPMTLLHVSNENSLGDNDKLILDCGYEIMKRKGRKQELAVHPFMKISVAFVRVRTLDDLVKQLNRNFDQLKLHGRDGNPKCEPEYYVPKMLEVDVDVGDPDTNCMWDLGWNDAMFAFLEKDDVVRDVEKQVISGLIDEVTRDLLAAQDCDA